MSAVETGMTGSKTPCEACNQNMEPGDRCVVCGAYKGERRINISKFIDENERYPGELWWIERDAFEWWK